MGFRGKLIEVYPENAGTSVNQDHAIGTQTLVVNSRADFPDEGGELSIDGVVYSYDSVVDSYESDEIHLTTTLSAAVEEGTEVLSLPLRTRRMGTVAIADHLSENLDTVIARLDHSLQLSLEDGRRDQGFEEDVICEYQYGDLFLVQVLDREAAVSFGPIDLDDHTDELPPSASPTVVLQAFSVGGLRWTVVPVANDDPSKFRIYASTNPAVETDAAHLVADTSQTTGTFDDINSVSLLPTDPLSAIPTYYARAIQYDFDGDAPQGAVSAGIVPKRAGVAEISATWAYLGMVEANQIAAGSIMADLALLAKLMVGGRIDINGDDSTIIIYAAELDDQGNRVELIRLDPAGSVFRGSILADDVSVLEGLILRGNESQISNDAVLTLMNGVADPTTSPDVAATWDLVSAPGTIPSGYSLHGLTDHATAGYITKLLWKAADSTGWVQVVNTATGLQVSLTQLADVSGITENLFSGIIRLGSNLFVGVQDYNVSGFDKVYLAKYNSTGSVYDSKVLAIDVELAFGQDHGNYSIRLGADYVNSRIFVAMSPEATEPYIVSITAATMAIVTQYLTIDDGSATDSAYWLAYGPFDQGVNRWLALKYWDDPSIVQSSSASDAFPASLDPNGDFAFPASAGARIFWHQTDAKFYMRTSSGTYYKLGSYHVQETAWASYAYTDGSPPPTTLDSPLASVVVPPRKIVSVQVPPYPSGVSGADVYVGYGVSAPADVDLHKRSETLTAQRTMLLTDGHVVSGANPPGANTFGAGGPGEIKSVIGGLSIKGDGTFNAPKRFQSGKVSITPVANTDSPTPPLRVTFATQFASQPAVIVQPETGSLTPFGGGAFRGHEVTNIDATGFDLQVYRTNTTAMNLFWFAMLPTQ